MSPSDTDVIKNVFADVLTLTTCNPRFSASTRLVVQAKLAHSQLFPNSGLPAATLHADPKSQRPGRGLQRRAHRHAVLGLRDRWPSAAGIFYAAYRFRRQRWVIYGVGAVGVLVAALVLLRGGQPAAPGQLLDRMLVEQPLSDHFRGFAAVAERDGGTTYAAICRGVADDDVVLSLLDGAPLPQRRPLLLLAAVHYLLLAGADHPLAALLRHGGRGARHGARRPGAGGTTSPRPSPTSAGRTGPSWSELIATRTTQTNEVGRCTALLPGLCHIASLYRWEVPLSLLDLGTSAGPQPALRRLRVHLPGGRGRRHPHRRARAARLSPSSAPPGTTSAQLPELRLPDHGGAGRASTSRPSTRSPTTPPCGCWPASGRTTRRASVACGPRWPTCAPRRDPPRLERGDMVTDLPRVVATIPGTNPLVVFHSWVAAYLDEAQQRRPGRARCVRSARTGRSTTSTARRPSRHPACPRLLRPCRGTGPTWPPRWCTSARTARRRSGWPTRTRTGTGSAGGLQPSDLEYR